MYGTQRPCWSALIITWVCMGGGTRCAQLATTDPTPSWVGAEGSCNQLLRQQYCVTPVVVLASPITTPCRLCTPMIGMLMMMAPDSGHVDTGPSLLSPTLSARPHRVACHPPPSRCQWRHDTVSHPEACKAFKASWTADTTKQALCYPLAPSALSLWSPR